MSPPAADSLRRKRFTRVEVDRMLEIGIFDGQRCELIDGELIDKTGRMPPHAQAIRNLCAWLIRSFGADRILIQMPVEAARADREWSLPEPDVAVLHPDSGESSARHPRGDELLLAVEVADSSLRQDLIKKRDLYARAEVPEYWVLDVQSRRLIVHRTPVGGTYRELTVLGESNLASCAARPDESVPVAQFLD